MITATHGSLTLRHGADDLATALIVFGTLILLALIVGQMVRKEPLISGSGIPQTELALAGQLPYPGFRIVASKFVGTLLSLSGGLSVGREGRASRWARPWAAVSDGSFKN